MREHSYRTALRWTGNRGSGTSTYRAYGRDHEVLVAGKPTLLGSSDPTFHGDPDRWNPEELLVASLSQCHLLAYLHVCASNGVVVVDYTDDAHGAMRTHGEAGEFLEVVLRPLVTVADQSMIPAAVDLHEEAHSLCFIARSVNFPVRHEPRAVAVP